jgi:UDP:flavonoid glycosyltransferase YjiC (YdhE family)
MAQQQQRQQPAAPAPPPPPPSQPDQSDDKKNQKKKVVIVTSGSRGDTQPYIALALELLARGHSVTIATEARMEALVRGFDARLGFALVPGDPTGLLWQPECQVMLRDGKLLPVMSKVAAHAKQHFAAALDAYKAACQGADVVVGAGLVLAQVQCCAAVLCWAGCVALGAALCCWLGLWRLLLSGLCAGCFSQAGGRNTHHHHHPHKQTPHLEKKHSQSSR